MKVKWCMVLAELARAGGSRQENKLKAEAVQDHTYYYLLTGTLSRTYLIGSMTERNVAHTANSMMLAMQLANLGQTRHFMT